MKKKFLRVLALGMCAVTAFSTSGITASAAQATNETESTQFTSTDDSLADDFAFLLENLDAEDNSGDFSDYSIDSIADSVDAEIDLSDDMEIVDATVKNGLVKEGGVFKFYKDGKWIKDKFGFVNYDGSKFLVAHGVVATKQSGLTQDPDHAGVWYYLAGGRVQTQHSGFCSYNGAWFLVKNGKLVNDATGFYKYDGGLFFLSCGRLLKTANGLVQDPNTKKWYFCANGQAQTSYTGLALYDGTWFYVQKGYFDPNFSNLIEWNGRIYEIKNGTMVKDHGPGSLWEVEPNNNMASATRLKNGVPCIGTIGANGDTEDWFAFDCNTGDDVTILCIDWLNTFLYTSAKLDLYCPDGTILHVNSVEHNGFEAQGQNYVGLDAFVSGTYYLRLWNYSSVSSTGKQYVIGIAK